jgi:hypothetical protein
MIIELETRMANETMFGTLREYDRIEIACVFYEARLSYVGGDEMSFTTVWQLAQPVNYKTPEMLKIESRDGGSTEAVLQRDKTRCFSPCWVT